MATVFGKTYRTIKSKLYSKRLIEIEQTALNVLLFRLTPTRIQMIIYQSH